MNLLLLFDEDFLPDGTALLQGRRAAHAHEVLKATRGDTLRVGRLRGQTGEADVLASAPDRLHLAVRLGRAPPPRPPVDLLLAIPRPKALKKVLAAVASLGVGRLVLVNAARVEKSYFGSHVLSPGQLQAHLTAGLEQAQDTAPPEIWVRERFRPFVEDELAAAFGTGERLLAHPAAVHSLSAPAPAQTGARTVVAIGPEGGWVPFELELLSAQGFRPFSLGARTLRVEVVIPFVLGQLSALKAW